VLCELETSWANAAKESSSNINIHFEACMMRPSFLFNKPTGTAREQWQSSPRLGRAQLPV
jgi:hypothetical protein